MLTDRWSMAGGLIRHDYTRLIGIAKRIGYRADCRAHDAFYPKLINPMTWGERPAGLRAAFVLHPRPGGPSASGDCSYLLGMRVQVLS